MKSIFARHGIPQQVWSDNGPQFSSNMFKKFSEDYNFTHTTSSPRYPASNGEAERAVRTVKEMLKKCDDPYLAMLIYRSTPLHNGFKSSRVTNRTKITYYLTYTSKSVGTLNTRLFSDNTERIRISRKAKAEF